MKEANDRGSVVMTMIISRRMIWHTSDLALVLRLLFCYCSFRAYIACAQYPCIVTVCF